MLKRSSIRKICIGAFCLLILLIVYLFPSKNNSENLTIDTKYTITNVSDVIYLLDSNDYVARLCVSLSSTESIDKALEAISYITENSEYSKLILNGFKPIIPSGTKIISHDLKDGNFKINFSKELLDIEPKYEMKMIEAIVYTLTSIESIKNVTILVEGNILTNLPSSKEYLPNPIDRNFGINKKYNIDSIKGLTKTTMYYLSKNNDLYYYIPVTKISNDTREKIEIIINELTSSPIHETNLMSYLNSEAALQNYEFLDKGLNIDFNNAILSDITSHNILEEVTYAINLSIKDNYDVNSVMYTVNKEKIATFDLKNLE